MGIFIPPARSQVSALLTNNNYFMSENVIEKSCCGLKVCLINPPVLGVLEPWYDRPDYGRTALAYLAGYLRAFSAHVPVIIDAKLERLDFRGVRKRVGELRPDVVGLGALTNEIKPAAYQAALIKRDFPQTPVVVGGAHVTAMPQKTLEEFPSFDVGVVGEGEQTLLELCNALQDGMKQQSLHSIDGLVVRQGRGILVTPYRKRIMNLDEIPVPAWDLLPPAGTYFVQTMRGCPYNCPFCMNPNGKIIRQRSVTDVIDELQWLVEDFQPGMISFGDELFSLDKRRTHKLLDAMIERRIARKTRWIVQTHVNHVDESLFAKFKAAGVERVELGVETGDDKTLKSLNKGINLEKVRRTCKAGKDAGVNIGIFLLFGLPNESLMSIERTIDIAVKINPDLPMFGVMTPYPGTEVGRMAAKSEGGYRLKTMDWDEYNKQIGGALEFAQLSRERIERLQAKAYLMVYLKNCRFIDLARVLWEYRYGVVNVLKKMVLGRDALRGILAKPADYEEMIRSPVRIRPDALVDAREKWYQYQMNELKEQRQSHCEKH